VVCSGTSALREQKKAFPCSFKQGDDVQPVAPLQNPVQVSESLLLAGSTVKTSAV